MSGLNKASVLLGAILQQGPGQGTEGGLRGEARPGSQLRATSCPQPRSLKVVVSLAEHSGETLAKALTVTLQGPTPAFSDASLGHWEREVLF